MITPPSTKKKNAVKLSTELSTGQTNSW